VTGITSTNIGGAIKILQLHAITVVVSISSAIPTAIFPIAIVSTAATIASGFQFAQLLYSNVHKVWYDTY
jgi:hypothetical protein